MLLGMIKDKNQDEKYIEMIRDYYFIDNRIARVNEKINHLEWNFSNRNLYGHTDYDGVHGVKRVGFSVEREVTKYVDAMERHELSITMLKRKKEYFQVYLDGLSLDLRRGLEREFKRNDEGVYKITLTNTHRELIMEILEIEEAISHEFKKELLPEHVKDLVLVETNDLTPDTLEESFDTMLEMLGGLQVVTS